MGRRLALIGVLSAIALTSALPGPAYGLSLLQPLRLAREIPGQAAGPTGFGYHSATLLFDDQPVGVEELLNALPEIRLSPETDVGVRRTIMGLIRQRRYEEALPLAVELQATEPGNPDGFVLAGVALIGLGGLGGIIPASINQNSCAHFRRPMEMIFQG